MNRYQVQLSHGAGYRPDCQFFDGELGAAKLYLDTICRRMRSIQAGRLVDTWQSVVVYEW